MTTEHQTSRTILKSPPELWAECSDAGSLARHIGEFGEIRITRLEPESTVAWEGDHASGTVEIEPAGWGTKVTLTASAKAGQVEDEPAAVSEEPSAVVEEPSAVVEEPPAVVEETVVVEVETVVVEEETVVVEEETVVVDHEAATRETELIEEAVDAEVEETSTEPHPVAPYPGGARGWRRLIRRTRALFGARATAVPSPVVPPDDEVSAQSVGSGYHIPVSEANASPERWPLAPAAATEGHPPAEAETDRPAEAEPQRPADAQAERPIDPPEPRPAEAERFEPQTAGPQPEKPPDSIDPDTVLAAALESLGQAHHRPFSRA